MGYSLLTLNLAKISRKNIESVVTAEPAQTGSILFLRRPGTRVQTLRTPLMSDTREPLTAPP